MWIEDCVRLEEANLTQYVRNSDEWLLKEVAEMDLVASIETGENTRRGWIWRERRLC